MYSVSFCCDDRYIAPACVAVESILKNCGNNAKEFVFYTFSNDLCESNIDKLKKLVESYKSTLEIVRISDDLMNDVMGSVQLNVKHISRATYFRLLLPFFLKQVETCLYIDCDILVRGDITPIFGLIREDKCICAVADDGSEYYAKQIGVKEYYNAGVLLMNFRAIRNLYTMEDFCKKIKSLLVERNLLMGDQDIVNLLYQDSLFRLSSKYNYQKHLKKLYSLTTGKKDLKDAVIVHYVTKDKPWQPSFFFPYVKEYYCYMKKYMTKKRRILYWIGKPYGFVKHTIEYCCLDILHYARIVKHKLIDKDG